MNIQEVVNKFNFFINKVTGAFFTIEEAVDKLDSGQLAVFSDYKRKYATSQEIKDVLAIFRASYTFNTTNTVSGYIVIPSNSNYLDLLDVQISFDISTRTMYYSVPMINEDVLSARLNSQIDPVTVTSPIGVQTAPRYFRLYPTSGYTGSVTYFRRPIKPVFAYTIISGRVVNYDPVNSVQLEFRDTEIDEIILKALEIAGVNLSDADLVQFSEMKTQQNFQNINKL